MKKMWLVLSLLALFASPSFAVLPECTPGQMCAYVWQHDGPPSAPYLVVDLAVRGYPTVEEATAYVRGEYSALILKGNFSPVAFSGVVGMIKNIEPSYNQCGEGECYAALDKMCWWLTMTPTPFCPLDMCEGMTEGRCIGQTRAHHDFQNLTDNACGCNCQDDGMVIPLVYRCGHWCPLC